MSMDPSLTICRYLMEKQAEEEVFTVSVGNLPPGENCVIKILYIAELPFEAGAVVFSLPSAVATTAARTALAHVNQSVTGTHDLVSSDKMPLDLEIAIENAQPIKALRSPTHALVVKRTESRAVVHLEGRRSDTGLFSLQIYAEAPNEPRMWVEEDGEHRVQSHQLYHRYLSRFVCRVML